MKTYRCVGGGGRAAAAALAVLGLAAGTCAAAPAGGTGEAGADGLSRTRFLMGAPLRIEARGGDAQRVIERAWLEVERLESILSNWRPDSEVSRVNATAAAGPVSVSPDFYTAVVASLEWAERTGGTFDPTVEPLVRSLGLRGPEGRLPGAGEPPSAGSGMPAPVGWRGVRLDPARRTVAFATPGMGLDFGGIGKGMALDAAARVLRESGVDSALLDFGGQVLVFGFGPDGGAWRIGIADPGDRFAAVTEVVLTRGSLATSGNSERAVVAEGRRVGHILDPGTGRPVEWNGSVTVLADDATSADALSKALFVLGPERGIAWAAGQGIQVLFVERDPQGRLIRRGTGALFLGVLTGTPNAAAESGLTSVPGPATTTNTEAQ